MLFSSLIFIWFFLPVTVLLYTLAPNRTIKNGVLLLASLFFYSWGEPVYLLLLLITVLISYGAGILLSLCHGSIIRKKAVTALFLITSFGILGYFKYFNFLMDTINRATGSELMSLRDIALPLGISFYTFQSVSYVTDTCRGKNPVQKNLFHLSLYICLFPQLLSGPIIKYHELVSQITDRRESPTMQAYGIKRFTYGLAKKVLLANSFGQVVDRILTIPADQLGTLTVWLMILLYTLQIYYDFSGYSDMAIGLGRMFGFRYAENFNYPYLSASITEFWRRWHISLSTWFREYLYFPLGGNRRGSARTYVNLFIVFLATGLWHGSSMNFICWGIYFGIFIVAERVFLSRLLEKNSLKLLNHIYVMLVLMFGWLLFRVNDMEAAYTLFKAMIRPVRGLWDVRIFANTKIICLMAAGILLCGPLQSLLPGLKSRLYDDEQTTVPDIVIMALLLILSTTVIVSGTYNAFIYFKF